MAAATAEKPDAISTAMPPAKSRVPPSISQPFPNPQWASTG
jgi:hypothetical protein